MKRWLLIPLALALTAAARPAPSLSSYVGKYPFDRVRGISLHGHPLYRALVRQAAPNATIRSTVLGTGVETPIEQPGALIVVQACEPHNCTDHEWTVAIRLPRGPAAVRYQDTDTLGDEARWYIGGAEVLRTDACWAGDHMDVPGTVVAGLAGR